MTSPSREEVDAKLKTLDTKVDGRLASFELALANGISVLNAKMDGHAASVDAQFARFDASLQKSQADTLKWVVGIVLLLGTIGLAIMTFLFNHISPKAPAAAAPIVITIPSPSQSMPGNPAAGLSSPPGQQHR